MSTRIKAFHIFPYTLASNVVFCQKYVLSEKDCLCPVIKVVHKYLVPQNFGNILFHLPTIQKHKYQHIWNTSFSPQMRLITYPDHKTTLSFMVAPLLFLISMASFTHLLYLVYKRWVKEAIEIRKRRGATMNRDEGQYFLSHIFDELLLDKSPKKEKNQLATPDFPQAEIQPVLVVAVSSSVEKEGRCPWNVHSKSIIFWIRIQEIFLIILLRRSWWIYSIIFDNLVDKTWWNIYVIMKTVKRKYNAIKIILCSVSIAVT